MTIPMHFTVLTLLWTWTLRALMIYFGICVAFHVPHIRSSSARSVLLPLRPCIVHLLPMNIFQLLWRSDIRHSPPVHAHTLRIRFFPLSFRMGKYYKFNNHCQRNEWATKWIDTCRMNCSVCREQNNPIADQLEIKRHRRDWHSLFIRSFLGFCCS